nr:hypothetical protein [Tanacetum cinerariifolium]
MVYQIDVKSAFLYGTIKEEVCQPQGFEDPDYLDKVYKVVKELYGLHQAPRAWYETLANYLLENGFQRGKIDQALFIKWDKYDILLVQIYVDDIIFDGKSASTPIDTEKPLLKDPDGEDVDVHTYRSMIGSLMYLTSSRPDIIYLKGKPYLGLWYPKGSPFDLVAYSDSDYDGVSLDRKSTTRGCQFLRYRLISWQCKKQTVVATSSTEAEYVATASCCAQISLLKLLMLEDFNTWFPNQTVSGKDSSNSLMADNFSKIIWYSTHHVALMKSWLVQKQMALGQTTTGKEILNPFMAGVNTPRSDEDRLELIELPVFLLPSDEKFRVEVIITEATIRDALHLDNAEGIECLPNEEIFTELARMGDEKPLTKLTFTRLFSQASGSFGFTP